MKERLVGFSLLIGLALIVILGFQAASATAERNNLRVELTHALERESACLLKSNGTP